MPDRGRRQFICLGIICSGILCVFASSPVHTARNDKITALPELESPRQIVIEKGRIYFVDKRDVVVYSFPEGSFMKKIGRLGQGPGEFAMGPSLLSVSGDRLIVGDLLSYECFNLEGVHTGSIKEPDSIGPYPLLPVGRHYVGFPMLRKIDGSRAGPTGRVYDSDLKLKKEFFGELPAFPPPPPPPGSAESRAKRDELLIRDYGDYTVYKDWIYVADSRRGLSISVFDENGNLLHEIKHTVDKVEVPESFVDDVVKEWKASKHWERIYSRLNPVVPEYFPAFIDFKIDGGRICVLTPAKKDGLYEIIVMDLDGKILEREFRFPLKPDFRIPHLNGLKYDIEGDELFWFDYNDDKETYELHIR